MIGCNVSEGWEWPVVTRPGLRNIVHLFLSINYNDVIMSSMASQITSHTIFLLNDSLTDQIKHQSSASLAFVWGIHGWPVNSPHTGPVTRKMFPFDDVIMLYIYCKFPHQSKSTCRTYLSNGHRTHRAKSFRLLVSPTVTSVIVVIF